MVKALQPNVIVKALSGAAVLWHFLPNDGSHSATIHRTFCRESWREGGSMGRLILVLGFFFWAPTLMGLVVSYCWRCGSRIKRTHGKSIFCQMREQIELAVRYAIPPPWYYIFEFYEDPMRTRASDYLYRFEMKTGLYHMLRDQLSSPETTLALSNKTIFAERCEEHSIPVIPVLAKVVDGVILQLDGNPRGLPKESFFLKANRGAGGRGASRWRYEAQQEKYYDTADSAFSAAELTAHVNTLSRTEDFVIRKLALNHSELADLNLAALNTVRVLTIMNEEGKAEVTHAVLRMASSRDVVIDNFHAGGIAAKVDIQSGILGQASNMGLTADSQWWDSHPLTDGPILGRTVPFWDEVKDVACRAHSAFADQIAIGWDIAVLDDGPKLVEGNKGPDLDIIQRIYREPIGNSRFGQLLVYHLERALEKKHGRKPQ